MKFIVAIVMFATLVSAEYQEKTLENLIKYGEECLKNHNVPPEDLEKENSRKFSNNPITHCYMKCILEKFELFDEEKGFNIENIHHQMVGGDHTDHSDAIHGKIEACTKEAAGENACKRAYSASFCLLRENLFFIRKDKLNYDHLNHSENHH